MKKLLIALFAVLLCSSIVSGQTDTILFMKGKTMIADISSVGPTGITIKSYINDRGKLISKQQIIESYRVYSVSENNTRSVLYQQDSMIGNYLSADDMHTFILGEQHARNHFKTKLHFYCGLGFGAAVSIFDTYDKGFFKTSPSFLS